MRRNNPFVNILGVDISCLSQSEVIQSIELILSENLKQREKEPFLIFTANVDHLMLLREDKDFSNAYKKADLIVADGMPLVWASRFLERPLPERVNGTNLALAILKKAQRRGWTVSFVGPDEEADEEVVEQAAQKLKRKFKGLKIIKFGKSKKVDILFACFGAPKQEKWLAKNKADLDVSVALGIGSAVDFFAGRFKRAPSWVQNLGFEWLFRLGQEPKRLWRRYLIRDMKFFPLVVKQIIFGRS